MPIDTRQFARLLEDTRRLVDHQNELRDARGDAFNIFSILGVEARENKAHSAFLAELLSPAGSHGLGSVFLECFVNILRHNVLPDDRVDIVDCATAKVNVEFYIGGVTETSGGRIDIYIVDSNGRSLSIENKIDAVDQPNQITRYINHNRNNNIVLYLTRDGKAPDVESSGDTRVGEDFHCISYGGVISEWLGQCANIASDRPFVRESIRQYQYLARKLAGIMDEKHEKELVALMLRHYDEAAYIANSFAKVTAGIGEDIRQQVLLRLKKRLKGKYKVTEGSKAGSKYSQIWIEFLEEPAAQACFGIESFSGQGHYDGHLFVGVFAQYGEASDFGLEGAYDRLSSYWPIAKKLDDVDGLVPNLSNANTLSKLYQNPDGITRFCNGIADQVVAFVDEIA